MQIEEDLQEIPVFLSDNKRVRTTCGTFSHVANNGLGLITIYTKMCETEEFFESTLLHEFAHALVHYLRHGAPDEDGCHGKTFQFVMLTMSRHPSKFVAGASAVAPETVYSKKK